MYPIPTVMGAALYAVMAVFIQGSMWRMSAMVQQTVQNGPLYSKQSPDGKRDFSAIAVVSDMDDLIYPAVSADRLLQSFKIPEIVVGDRKGSYRVQ